MPYKDSELRKKANAEAVRRYRARHPDRVAAYAKKYCKEHSKERVQRTIAWREAHPDQVQQYSTLYRKENAKHIAARQRAYHQANKDKCRKWDKARQARIKADVTLHEKRKASQRRYYELNAERRKQQVTAYRKRHPEKAKLWAVIASARRRKARAGVCTAAQWEARMEYYGNCCAYCWKELDKVHRDHIKPVSAGGSEWPCNLVPACPKCNLKKHMKRWIPRPVWAKETLNG